MRTAVFSTKPYDRQFLDQANADFQHTLTYFDVPLKQNTHQLAAGFPAICVFVNDMLDADILTRLKKHGTQLIALRCAGFNNVDIRKAHELDIRVARVPAYSPYAVAEHSAGMILSLNRKLHRAYARIREGNFALHGLLGFDLHGKTVGIIGTGKIGQVMAHIMKGFGCTLLAHDPLPNDACRALGVQYVALPELYAASDIVTLHCPLTPSTHHMIDKKALSYMKDGVMLINTSRGGLVDTPAVIDGLKSQKIGSLGLDVYEEEGDLFFHDLSDYLLQDDVFARLLTFPNVLITGHQAFFTQDALTNIADTTLSNIHAFESTGAPMHEVTIQMLA